MEKDIINVALIGHTGEGKTTLAEAMLYHAKAIDRMGKVADGTTVMDYDEQEIQRKISISLACAYLEWKGQSSLKPVLTELSLTSKRWLFGGTLDAVQIGGRIAMLDWKTSNGIYQDHIIQVAGGYAILWEENYPDMPIDGGFHILRFSKEDGGFTHHFWPEIEGAKEAFIHMRILYELDRKLKGRL